MPFLAVKKRLPTPFLLPVFDHVHLLREELQGIPLRALFLRQHSQTGHSTVGDEGQVYGFLNLASIRLKDLACDPVGRSVS